MARGIKLIVAAAAILAAPAAQAFPPAQLGVAAGLFRFQATDYYYPNFYEEAGYRGELSFALGDVNRHTARLLAAGYPMDDNIFDAAAEYAFRRNLSLWSFDILAEPALGFQYTKLQYPSPYYPTVEHNFLPWLRGGADVGAGRAHVGPLSARGAYRFRWLRYLGKEFFKDAEGKMDRYKFVHGPFAEVTWDVGARWSVIGRGGLEFGGYYDDIFLTPADLARSRPYAEAGAAFRF